MRESSATIKNTDLWSAVLGEMEISLSRANFTTWFKNTLIVSRDQNSVLVSVPNGFVREWLENKFSKQIVNSLRKLVPEIREVRYVIGQPKIELARQDFSRATIEQRIEERLPPEADQEIDLATRLNKKFSLESFVVGSNNELAHAAATAVARAPAKLYNPLFIYGGVGLGKTHLMQAVGNKISAERQGFQALYIPAERLTADIIEAIKMKTIEDLKRRYGRLDLLMIDDVQFIAGKEKTQDIVFSIFNELYTRSRQVILTSDRPPKAIATLEERLSSRFEGGMIADVGLPDFETRLAILKAKCVEWNYAENEAILTQIATNIQKNVRELEGALRRVYAFAQVYNRLPDPKEIKTILTAYTSIPYQKTSLQTVLKAVADFYTLPLTDLTKRSRKKEVVRPRQVAMYLLREEIKLSYPEIGLKLGGRDHSTVIHACEKIKKEEAENEALRQELVFIKERVYSSGDK